MDFSIQINKTEHKLNVVLAAKLVRLKFDLAKAFVNSDLSPANLKEPRDKLCNARCHFKKKKM